MHRAAWPSGLGKGLQSPVHRFDSGRRLQQADQRQRWSAFGFGQQVLARDAGHVPRSAVYGGRVCVNWVAVGEALRMLTFLIVLVFISIAGEIAYLNRN